MQGPKCPHCGNYYEIEPADDDDLITYHGHEGGPPIELECSGCEKVFWVREIVRRSYESSLVPGGCEWL